MSSRHHSDTDYHVIGGRNKYNNAMWESRHRYSRTSGPYGEYSPRLPPYPVYPRHRSRHEAYYPDYEYRDESSLDGQSYRPRDRGYESRARTSRRRNRNTGRSGHGRYRQTGTSDSSRHSGRHPDIYRHERSRNVSHIGHSDIYRNEPTRTVAPSIHSDIYRNEPPRSAAPIVQSDTVRNERIRYVAPIVQSEYSQSPSSSGSTSTSGPRHSGSTPKSPPHVPLPHQPILTDDYVFLPDEPPTHRVTQLSDSPRSKHGSLHQSPRINPGSIGLLPVHSKSQTPVPPPQPGGQPGHSPAGQQYPALPPPGYSPSRASQQPQHPGSRVPAPTPPPQQSPRSSPGPARPATPARQPRSAYASPRPPSSSSSWETVYSRNSPLSSSLTSSPASVSTNPRPFRQSPLLAFNVGQNSPRRSSPASDSSQPPSSHSWETISWRSLASSPGSGSTTRSPSRQGSLPALSPARSGQLRSSPAPNPTPPEQSHRASPRPTSTAPVFSGSRINLPAVVASILPSRSPPASTAPSGSGLPSTSRPRPVSRSSHHSAGQIPSVPRPADQGPSSRQGSLPALNQTRGGQLRSSPAVNPTPPRQGHRASPSPAQNAPVGLGISGISYGENGMPHNYSSGSRPARMARSSLPPGRGSSSSDTNSTMPRSSSSSSVQSQAPQPRRADVHTYATHRTLSSEESGSRFTRAAVPSHVPMPYRQPYCEDYESSGSSNRTSEYHVGAGSSLSASSSWSDSRISLRSRTSSQEATVGPRPPSSSSTQMQEAVTNMTSSARGSPTSEQTSKRRRGTEPVGASITVNFEHDGSRQVRVVEAPGTAERLKWNLKANPGETLRFNTSNLDLRVE